MWEVEKLLNSPWKAKSDFTARGMEVPEKRERLVLIVGGSEKTFRESSVPREKGYQKP